MVSQVKCTLDPFFPYIKMIFLTRLDTKPVQKGCWISVSDCTFADIQQATEMQKPTIKVILSCFVVRFSWPNQHSSGTCNYPSKKKNLTD